MSLYKALPIALFVALSCASPLPNEPTKVLPRALPTPSDYPLDDGSCEHEWKYLNFNKNDDTDKAHLEKLHWNDLAPYKRFFPQNDDEDNWEYLRDHVVKVLTLITGTSSTDGKIGSIVETFVVDNADFGDKYPDEANKEKCSTEGTQAYTATDSGSDDIESDGLEKIHFCDIAWESRSFEDITSDCGSLDPYPSENMDTFARIALHEMTHMSSVGPPIIKDSEDEDDDGLIKDVQMADGDTAYGPQNAHALVDKDQDEFWNPALAETNANNYAWMSLDSLISRHCSEVVGGDDWATFFTESPPAIPADDE